MKTNYFWIAVIVMEFVLAIVGFATRNIESARHSVTMAVLYMIILKLYEMEAKKWESICLTWRCRKVALLAKYQDATVRK